MSERWIVNASPLITLGKARLLDIVFLLGVDCIVPDAVGRELLSGPADDPARIAIESGTFGRIRAPLHIPPRVARLGLGAGETAVLALSLELQPCTAALDDLAARRAARESAVPVIGTLGIVVRARKRGLIPAARPLIESLRQCGLRVHDSVVQEILQALGE